MSYFLNPLLSDDLQREQEMSWIVTIGDDEVDILQTLQSLRDNLNSKVDKDQGFANAEKIFVTDSKGVASLVSGLLMTIQEREKLSSITNDKFITKEEREKLANISGVLFFRDVLYSVSDLDKIGNPAIGDTYYITSTDSEGVVTYTQYVWTGSRWAIIGTSDTAPKYTAGTAVELNFDVINVLYDNKTILRNANNQLYIPVDSQPTKYSTNFVTSNSVYEVIELLDQKQDKLTFDSAPTKNSTNPVTSGGVFNANNALKQSIEQLFNLLTWIEH